MTRFRTVVCAVDFSETSQDAVAVARDIAEGAGAHLHLLHVVLDLIAQVTSDEDQTARPAIGSRCNPLGPAQA